MNLVLIGMSGVGKSLIGKKLSKEFNYHFIDVDNLIEQKMQMKLQDIINKFGDKKFLELEEKTILDLNKDNCVIAPGGSIIYSKKSIEHLKKKSIIIFLDASLENLKSRIKNTGKRGIVYLKRKSYEELFKERVPQYKKYSDISIKIDNLKINQIIRKIKENLKDVKKK